MVKILVADDEHHIVNYLGALLEAQEEEWSTYKAYNGIEVLQLLEKTDVDIVLLDIHMPGLSGLEVAEKINEQWPNTRIIFLTAYDNFDYIYRADKLEVEGFLLKTEDDSVILQKIEETVEKIIQQNSTINMMARAKQQEILLHHMLQQDVLKELTTGFDERAMKEKMELLGEKFPLCKDKPVFCMLIIPQSRIYNAKKNQSLANTMLTLQFFHRIFQNRFAFVYENYDKEKNMILLQVAENDWPISMTPALYLKNCAQSLVDFYMDTFHMAIHLLVFEHEFSIYETNQMMNSLLLYEADLQKSTSTMESLAKVVTTEDLKHAHFQEKEEITESHYASELIFYLQKGEQKKYFELVDGVAEQCVKHRSMHQLSCIRYYNTISLMLLNEILKNKLERKIAMQIALYPLYYLNDFTSWEQAFHYLKQISRVLFRYQSDRVIDKNQLLIQKVKDFVSEHYREPLNLAVIANYVNYNESYISRLFKQINGIGLNDYMNQYRIEQAKKYLKETNDSIQQIAINTGFDTSQYFSSVFKKYCGVSPSDYRMRS